MSSITISHAGLCVSDLETSIRFYTEGLGFHRAETYTAGDEIAPAAEIPSGAKMTMQMLVKDQVRLELLWWEKPGSHGTPSSARNQLGLTHLSFTVDDIEQAEARLVELGGTPIESTRSHWNRGPIANLIFLTDPDGTRIELVKWRIALNS
jgi:catechol 2,3-dioxygenase-like lactoylglutathione lyase family enzyme